MTDYILVFRVQADNQKDAFVLADDIAQGRDFNLYEATPADWGSRGPPTPCDKPLKV